MPLLVSNNTSSQGFFRHPPQPYVIPAPTKRLKSELKVFTDLSSERSVFHSIFQGNRIEHLSNLFDKTGENLGKKLGMMPLPRTLLYPAPSRL